MWVNLFITLLSNYCKTFSTCVSRLEKGQISPLTQEYEPIATICYLKYSKIFSFFFQNLLFSASVLCRTSESYQSSSSVEILFSIRNSHELLQSLLSFDSNSMEHPIKVFIKFSTVLQKNEEKFIRHEVFENGEFEGIGNTKYRSELSKRHILSDTLSDTHCIQR